MSTTMSMSTTIDDLMRIAPVIPVLVVDDTAQAVPLAEALVAGGLKVLEVTLRTPAALDVLRAMKQVPGAIVGAGTVLDPHQFEAAMHAGAEFIVSPGLTESLARAVTSHGVPFLPGVATAGEIMRGLDLGLTHFKFFPAMAAGGVPALKAIAAPFGGVRFCPTGGIRQETAGEWLAMDSVLCVGGSWLVPKGPPDYAAIEQAARAAGELAQ
jgi:2-dehydro-3-deoxyphosphogluconate aldolase/(4S)-4-hydroxy-2-oxoglutarate aldolase